MASIGTKSYDAVVAQKVAFLGLGVMGLPMAGHLARAGHHVTVYNRTPAKAQAWASEFGGRHAATPREAVAGAQIVFACVGNDDDLRSVVLGPDGAFAGMAPGAVFVDHTTASADVARELYVQAKELGLNFIDAPVSGGRRREWRADHHVRRRAGSLRRHRRWPRPSGAPSRGWEPRRRPACQDGQPDLHRRHRAGPLGSRGFRPAADLDMKLVLDVISKGAAQSWQMENRGGTMVDDKFDFGFAVDWMRRTWAGTGRSAQQRRPVALDRAGGPVLRRCAENGRRPLGYVQPDQAPARLTPRRVCVHAAPAFHCRSHRKNAPWTRQHAS